MDRELAVELLDKYVETIAVIRGLAAQVDIDRVGVRFSVGRARAERPHARAVIHDDDVNSTGRDSSDPVSQPLGRRNVQLFNRLFR